MFDTYRYDLADNQAYQSIRRKYTGANMYPLNLRDDENNGEEVEDVEHDGALNSDQVAAGNANSSSLATSKDQ